MYDVESQSYIKDKTRILSYIACPPAEPRVIPDLFDLLCKTSKDVAEKIKADYENAGLSSMSDSQTLEAAQDSGKKFISKMIMHVESKIHEHSLGLPEDKGAQKAWDELREKLMNVWFTKMRLKRLRELWRDYEKNHRNWKKFIVDLSEFLNDKTCAEREELPKFDPARLKLVTIDLIS